MFQKLTTQIDLRRRLINIDGAFIKKVNHTTQGRSSYLIWYIHLFINMSYSDDNLNTAKEHRAQTPDNHHQLEFWMEGVDRVRSRLDTLFPKPTTSEIMFIDALVIDFGTGVDSEAQVIRNYAKEFRAMLELLTDCQHHILQIAGAGTECNKAGELITIARRLAGSFDEVVFEIESNTPRMVLRKCMEGELMYQN